MAKILIVDDSETQRTQLRLDLEGGGHSVVEGIDGLDGLNSLAAHPDTQLIICDLKMPRMDGLTMCAKVHETESVKRPIFMMTTEASPELKATGKARGVVAWVTKPYVADKLLAAIEKILR